MADVSGPQGSRGPLYTSLAPKSGLKSTVSALLGGVLRKIRKADPFNLPSLKSEQAKSKQPPPKPPRNLKLRAAMKAESKLFIQVLPQEGRYTSAPVPKPRLSKSSSSVSPPQEQVRSDVESKPRSKKPAPPVAPRSGKSAPKKPIQPKLQADDLIRERGKLKSTQVDTVKPTTHSDPLYANASSSSAYENVSGNEKFRYHAQYENVTVQDESDYVSAEEIQKAVQEQRKKNKPTPAPRTRKGVKDDHQYSTLNHGVAPKPKPRTYGNEHPAGYAKLGQFNTYDTPRGQKVPSHYDIPKRQDSIQQPEYSEIQSRDPKVRSNPAYSDTPPPLPPRNAVKSSLDSIDSSTGERLYESLDDEDFELETLERMLELEDDDIHPNDASNLLPLFNDLIELQAEMPDLIQTFKSRRPSKSKPIEWAAHMRQERALMKQQLDNKGFEKLRDSIIYLIGEELTTPQEREKVRSRVAKINEALAPVLTVKYGIEGAKDRALKAPDD
ncbi:MAG: hypothetical protein ACR2PX_10455 [Endozoicomonas sp.]|uniref:hypothetical protein n=1 Tax=Endozoicomonas sp. TaxID=1892382 RepID=UPI003D9AD6CF